MNEQNPMRWREPGAGAPDGFRELLDSAALDEASPAQLSRFVERATGALGTTSSAALPVAAGALPTGKLVAGVLAVAGGAALLWALSQGGEPPRAAHPRQNAAVAASPRTVASPAAVQAVGRPRTAVSPAAPGPSPVPAATEQTLATTDVSARAPARREPASAADTLAEEVRLLQSAREALSGSPAAAYRFAEQHRTRFPRGALAQEREVLAIESLLRQGRAAQARVRADRFRQAYPRSGHLDRFPELRDNPPQ